MGRFVDKTPLPECYEHVHNRNFKYLFLHQIDMVEKEDNLDEFLEDISFSPRRKPLYKK